MIGPERPMRDLAMHEITTNDQASSQGENVTGHRGRDEMLYRRGNRMWS
jgi:hypothetical protein